MATTISYTVTATLNIASGVAVQSDITAVTDQLKSELERNILAQNIGLGDSAIRVASVVEAE